MILRLCICLMYDEHRTLICLATRFLVSRTVLKSSNRRAYPASRVKKKPWQRTRTGP